MIHKIPGCDRWAGHGRRRDRNRCIESVLPGPCLPRSLSVNYGAIARDWVSWARKVSTRWRFSPKSDSPNREADRTWI